jgi:hypothetical protein
MREKFWDKYSAWEEAEDAWNAMAGRASSTFPLKIPAFVPSIQSIAPGEGCLRWKALRWVIKRDRNYRLVRSLLRHPFRYGCRYLASVVRKTPYVQDGDLFFYGVKNVEEMMALMMKRESILIVGFSYCQKPFECPAGRFGEGCCADLSNMVCQQCFVGKAMHSLPTRKTIPVAIPTINDIGKHVLQAIHEFPDHQILFVITACEMALHMFGDFGNMVGVQGIGIRLGGRVCNTMRAFALSEEGIKPGLTTVLPLTQGKMFDLIRFWRQARMKERDCAEQGKKDGDSPIANNSIE